MLAREAEEGEGLLDCILDPLGQPRVFCLPFGEPCGEISLGLGEIATIVEPPELPKAVVGMLSRQVIQGVPEKMNVAALIGCLAENLADGSPEAGMIIGDDKFDAVKATGLQGKEEVPPGGAALAIGHVNGKDLAASIPMNTDGDQDSLAHDDAGLAYFLVASVEDEVRKRLGEMAAGKGGKALVQTLVDGRDGRGRKGVAAELLGDRLDLPGRDPLHIHLGKSCYQGSLRALISFEQLGREVTLPVLRDPQLKLANPGDQGAPVIAGAVADPLRRPFSLAGAERVGHFGFEHLLHHGTNHLAQPIRVRKQKLFDRGDRWLTFLLGHGGFPSKGIGDSKHHQPAMTALDAKLLQNLPHTTAGHAWVEALIEDLGWVGFDPANGIS